jgi:DNA modification methylase
MEILQQFKELIPPLSNEEYKQLEANCLDEGIREPILTWNNYIIDGHNRYNIAKQWNLEYDTESKNFSSEEAVKEWMILNQFGRRNLSNYQRSVLALQLEDVFKAKAQERMLSGNPVLKSEQGRTIEKIGKVASVGKDTIAKVKKIQEKAPEEIKAKLSTGEVSINAAYKEIKKEEKKEEKKIIIETTKEQRLNTNKIQAKIYNENCVDFLDRFTDGSVDLLLTDPPYSTDIINVKEFIDTWLLKSLNKVKETGRAFICIGAYPVETYTYLQTLLNTDWTVDNPLVWTYRNTLGVTPKMKYNLNYQFVLHLYKETSKPLDNRITNEMFSVQDINAPDGRVGDRFHTWQKPDELAKRLINHTTNEKDIIIDPFACTGTFILNGADLGRKTYGCDIDKNALKIAYERGCRKGL